ncbi:MAG: cobalamin B12-binding domain-containing protein [Candidatus Lokiarchaeota archaeon]|nr:cobalamin B12-binding domain-containing protein [Candidatus Lokiarchaeota archaeon]
MSNDNLEQITEATAKGDYKSIGKLVRKASRQGISRENIIQALSAGLTDVSKKYKVKGMYLDDIIKSAGAFEVGIQSLGLSDEPKESEKKIVIGVMGGPWTIGTNIVAANLKAKGFEVINAGSDISPEKIAQVVKESDARIVASAIYLMQSKGEVEKLENELWKLGVRHKIRTILSGPAGSPAMAAKFNVDAYVKDVNELLMKSLEYSKDLKDEMTSYDRVMTSVKHKEPDRVPFMPFAQTFTAKFAEIPFSTYVSKAEKFLEGQMKAYNAFGWDALCFSSDVGMYAGALGAKVEFPYDDVPRVVKPLLSHSSMYEDFQKFKMPDLTKAGRLTESIKAIELAKKEVEGEVPIIGWTEGPFQGVTLLSGADPLSLFYTLDHVDEFKEILDWYTDFEIEVVKAMYEAGADIIGVGETAAYFMSPTYFKQFCLEPEKKACHAIKKLGMIPLIHCCGYVPQCVHFSKETNPGGAIQFDYQVDLAWAKELLRGEVTIMGNLDYNKLTLADPKQVSDDCDKKLKIAAEGGGYWLAFGCEIPRELPIDNMKAILRTLKTSGKYPIQ